MTTATRKALQDVATILQEAGWDKPRSVIISPHADDIPPIASPEIWSEPPGIGEDASPRDVLIAVKSLAASQKEFADLIDVTVGRRVRDLEEAFRNSQNALLRSLDELREGVRELRESKDRSRHEE